MEEYKRLKNGVSDFRILINENGYYVDKTPYIKEMEDTPFFVLLRPRRFGKSLFLSMLSCYYDVNEKDNFDALFKGTWIASHPTVERGKYQVLSLDFSMLNNTTDNLLEKFNDYCCGKVDDFIYSYKTSYPDYLFDAVLRSTTFEGKMNRINNYAKRQGISLCLIIDEYDNFTNTILAGKGHELYHAITHADVFYREVFKVFKGIFSRIVMTVVSTVTLDDLTSGFNIADNVSLTKQFNNVLGFTTEEVVEMLHYYTERGLIPKDEDRMLKEMAAWYDGYCFSKSCVNSGVRIFNSNMVIKYLRSYINNGEAPDSMLDDNTRTDYTKMHQLLHLDQLNGNRKSTLMAIAQDGYTTGDIVTSFRAERLTDPTIFTSLLFYYGMVSITGMDGLTPILGIPNNNVRKQYYDYLVEEYNRTLPINTVDLNAAYKEAALNGAWREMVELLCKSYHDYTSVRSQIEGERHIQGFLLGYLSLNSYYLTAPEVEVNHGYCDFFLMPDVSKTASIAHSYILELKYLASSDTDAKAASLWQEAVAQIHKYVQAPKVRLLSHGTKLHGIVLLIKGTELLRTEEIVTLDLT
jgi:hypothetical protein